MLASDTLLIRAAARPPDVSQAAYHLVRCGRSIYWEAENPRGQLGFYIESDGSAIPYRLKVRGPCFCNLSILGELCREVLLADVPAIIGSIDVVMGEVDR